LGWLRKLNLVSIKIPMYRVGPGCGGFSKFVIIDQYFDFAGEGCDCTFNDVEFHAVSSARGRFCGLVVTVLGYRSGGQGSIPGTTRKKT
jgi:hypothetical protein